MGCSQFITRHLCRSFDLTFFPCCSMEPFPCKTILYEPLQHDPFPQASVLRNLLQCGSFPPYSVFKEHSPSVWVPHRIASPASKPTPSLHGSMGPARNLLQHGLSTASKPPSDMSTSSDVRSFMGCRWISAPPINLHGLQEDQMKHTMVFTTGCREMFALVPEAPLHPPSSLTFAKLFLSHVLTSLFGCSSAGFFPLS